MGACKQGVATCRLDKPAEELPVFVAGLNKEGRRVTSITAREGYLPQFNVWALFEPAEDVAQEVRVFELSGKKLNLEGVIAAWNEEGYRVCAFNATSYLNYPLMIFVLEKSG